MSSDVWVIPTPHSPACFVEGAAPGKLTRSKCGVWLVKVDATNMKPNPTNGLAPDFEICELCAAQLGIKKHRGSA